MASSSGEEGAGPAPAPGPALEPAPAPKVRYCAVYDCVHTHRTHPDIPYFGFPKDKNRIKIWAEKIRRPDIIRPNGKVSGYYRVCATHFLPQHVNDKGKRRRLKRSAVPLRNLPHRGPYVQVADAAAPSQQQINGKTLARSKLEVCEYLDKAPKPKPKKKKVPRPPPPVAPPDVRGLLSNCDGHLAANIAEFVKLAARLQTGQDSKNLCVELLHSNPRAYYLLQTSLGLPTVRELHRYCAPRLTDLVTIIDLLKPKADRMTDKEKHCTLSVDFIDARPHLFYNITLDRLVGLHEIDGTQSPLVATRAVVITARGLLTRWTQPVALCYLTRYDEAFKPWISKIIGRLQTVGLTVHALVCDPTAPPSLRENLTDQPFFVDKTKIYIIYDPPRLMKKLLCEFMVHDFNFDKGIARWSDILDYRKMERNKPMTLTPELTDACINSAAVQRMKPQRAARILSRALAAALINHTDQGLLSDSARPTANFILKIRNLYDLLNSTTMKTSSEFKKGLSQDQSQTGFLTYMKSFFKSLKLENSCGSDYAATTKLSDDWRVTIEAVLALQKDLQPLQPYILTENLHLIDNVAQSARREARLTKPSCQQIFTAFKKQVFHELLQLRQEKSDDLNSLLARIVNDATAGPQINSFEADDDIRVQPSDYRPLRLPKKRNLMSAAKHLLRAALRVHGDCKLAVDYMNEPPQLDFLQLVQNLDEALTSALREGAGASGFLRELLLDVHVLDCALPCECFPLDYLKKLFFRLRLYSLLRHNQKRFKSNKVDLEINSLE